ncbi:hypothetical protein DPMN_084620 [Dreissena polymorpha]|uniref:Uncharacterized protein n=1 Tax=Dreissena polymorpha TaxID=45954 RepID=A0A9D4BL21_DREPO|nr:hypothetical protein DPMN_084620 [Dreissena polymorpha]
MASFLMFFVKDYRIFLPDDAGLKDENKCFFRCIYNEEIYVRRGLRYHAPFMDHTSLNSHDPEVRNAVAVLCKSARQPGHCVESVSGTALITACRNDL